MSQPPSPIQVNALTVGLPYLTSADDELITLTDTTGGPEPSERQWSIRTWPTNLLAAPSVATSTDDVATFTTTAGYRGEAYVAELYRLELDGTAYTWRTVIAVPLADGTWVPTGLVSGNEMGLADTKERDHGFMGTVAKPAFGEWCRQTRALATASGFSEVEDGDVTIGLGTKSQYVVPDPIEAIVASPGTTVMTVSTIPSTYGDLTITVTIIREGGGIKTVRQSYGFVVDDDGNPTFEALEDLAPASSDSVLESDNGFEITPVAGTTTWAYITTTTDRILMLLRLESTTIAVPP